MGHFPKGCLLFDWGDTLMRDFKEFNGPMHAWPCVEAVPGAARMLATLHSGWKLAIATNANDSGETEILAALQRVDLSQWLDKVYCFKKIGYVKPSREFFQYILDDLKLGPRSICMIGDNYESDVLGANHCGIRAIWFNQHSKLDRSGELHRTIHALAELPDLLLNF
jgi:FMN phosphatase YigB (HAD superfamily)